MLNQIIIAGKIVEEPTIKTLDDGTEYYSMKVELVKNKYCKKEDNIVEVTIRDKQFDKIAENFKSDKYIGLLGEITARVIDNNTVNQIEAKKIELVKNGADIKDDNSIFNQIVMVGNIVSINDSKDKKIPSSFTMKHIDKNSNSMYFDCVVYNDMASNMNEYCDIGTIVGVKGHIESNDNSGFSIVSERVTFLRESNKSKEETKEEELGNEI